MKALRDIIDRQVPAGPNHEAEVNRRLALHTAPVPNAYDEEPADFEAEESAEAEELENEAAEEQERDRQRKRTAKQARRAFRW